MSNISSNSASEAYSTNCVPYTRPHTVLFGRMSLPSTSVIYCVCKNPHLQNQHLLSTHLSSMRHDPASITCNCRRHVIAESTYTYNNNDDNNNTKIYIALFAIRYTLHRRMCYGQPAEITLTIATLKLK